MGNFGEVIDKWLAAGRQDDVDAIQQILSALKASHSQIHANLDNESVSPLPMEELLEALLTGPNTTVQETISALCTFCYSNPRCGPERDEARNAVFGHVQTRRKLEEWLREDASGYATGGTGHAGPIVDTLFTLDLTQLILLLDDIPITKVVSGDNRTVWSVFQPGNSDPFHGVQKSTPELIRRLGLGENQQSEEHVAWSHSLKSGQLARWATAIDAATYKYYRPGGKTEPLQPPQDGIDEVVHEAVYGRDLENRIESTG
jgi:hypothetical protein